MMWTKISVCSQLMGNNVNEGRQYQVVVVITTMQCLVLLLYQLYHLSPAEKHLTSFVTLHNIYLHTKYDTFTMTKFNISPSFIFNLQAQMTKWPQCMFYSS